MNNKCPHHQARVVSYSSSQVQQTKHIVSGVQASSSRSLEGFTQIENDYIDYALLIQEFVRENNNWINNILENCYEKGMTRELYLSSIYQAIAAKLGYNIQETYNLNYEKLINGIGTAILIINTLLLKIPDLPQNLCIQHCENIMKSIHFEDLPLNPQDKIKEYNNFIESYLTGKIQIENQGKLFCPIKYTTEGNAFFKLIIASIYKHFPV